MGTPSDVPVSGPHRDDARLADAVPGASTARDGPTPDPSSGERLQLLLVEGHAAVREALAAALEAESDIARVTQAGSLAEARNGTDHVDVAVVDMELPDGRGPDLVADLRRRNPEAQVLALVTAEDRGAAAHAVERGVAGLLGHEAHLQDVVAAIRKVRGGSSLMPLDEVVELLRLAGRRREQELRERRARDSLTAREREVLQLLAVGVGSRAAAARLYISPRTHRNHVANILAKFGVHSQLQALLFAVRHGIVELGHADGP